MITMLLLNRIKHNTMVILYPRQCTECNRSYRNRFSYSGHKKKCERYRHRNAKVEVVQQPEIDEIPCSVEQIEQEKLTCSVERIIEQEISFDIPSLQIYLKTCSTFYVLQTPHSYTCGLNVYKIGRTTDMTSRKGGYPKGSIIIQQLLCRDSHHFERYVKNELKIMTGVRHRVDFGEEYFEIELMRLLNFVMNAYERCKMSPACISSNECEPIVEDDKTEKLIEQEYRKMILNKKLLAITNFNKKQNIMLTPDMLDLYTKLNDFNMDSEKISETSCEE